ncbi:FAH family protein [Ancylostoma caninum]|uniref:oxaloacetate tautomerase n=1 Tax=Ancylostoma caninum TaxID=29170 RepID=A0A368FCC3_ANCCA|nr:FAH family protein [Ancylostoma caninum]
MALAGFRTIGKKIVCVGRNYKDHALELGNPIPTKPLLFLKSPNAFVQEGHPIVTPAGCKNLHQEVELGVVIGKTAKFSQRYDCASSERHMIHLNVPRSEAMSYVGGYTVALDMTARDFQVCSALKLSPCFCPGCFAHL